jgi:hypothetical protein
MKADQLTSLLAFSLSVWRTRRSFYDRKFQSSFTSNAAFAIAATFSKFQTATKVKRSLRRRDRQMERLEFQTMLGILSQMTL